MTIIGAIRHSIGNLPTPVKAGIGVAVAGTVGGGLWMLREHGVFERNNGKTPAEIGADFLKRYDADDSGAVSWSERDKLSHSGTECTDYDTDREWKSVRNPDGTTTQKWVETRECVEERPYWIHDHIEALFEEGDSGDGSLTAKEIAAVAARYDTHAPSDGKLSGDEIRAFNDEYENQRWKSSGSTRPA